MSLLSSATVLSLVDSMAIVLAQAYQLARARLASAGSPILRLLVQRDQSVSEADLLLREVETDPHPPVVMSCIELAAESPGPLPMAKCRSRLSEEPTKRAVTCVTARNYWIDCRDS